MINSVRFLEGGGDVIQSTDWQALPQDRDDKEVQKKRQQQVRYREKRAFADNGSTSDVKSGTNMDES